MSHLCLVCRSVGHIATECRSLQPEFLDQDWVFSSQRAKILKELLPTNSTSLCSRCTELDILTMFEGRPPWTGKPDDVEIADIFGSPHHRNLGVVGKLKYLSDCALCICLFGLTPTPENVSDQVHLLADWTVHRIEGDIEMDSSSKNCYDLHIFASLVSDTNPFVSLAGQTGDALALVREPPTHRSLTARVLNPNILDLSWILHNLDVCERLHHLTCGPTLSQTGEKIRLIDVASRRVVVAPNENCDYLTLSYVWGQSKPPAVSCGDKLPNMPQTVEDAITLTQMLGKRFVWIDCVCIDLSDTEQRTRQIRAMSDIYKGAYASIVALSGTSMNSGLPRLGSPYECVQPQLSCQVGDQHLVGLSSTLSAYVWGVKYGDRCWTLQEGLLARRNIYISDHQVYFECNAMQCSESLDESTSWIHQFSRYEIKGYQAKVFGSGVLRNSHAFTVKINDPQLLFQVLVNLYTQRKLTDPADGLHAFTGILRHIQSLAYKDGFIFGLPIVDLDWALHWSDTNGLQRRNGFPTWSWVGWIGHVWTGTSAETTKPTPASSTHFLAWTIKDDRLTLIHPTSSRPKLSESPENHLFSRDTIFDQVASLPLQKQADLRGLSAAEASYALVIECAVCDLSTFLPITFFNKTPNDLVLTMNDISCRGTISRTRELELDSKPPLLLLLHDGAKSPIFALTARERHGDWVNHRFLVLTALDEVSSCAWTTNTVSLDVPVAHPEALNGLVVERRRVVLV